MSQPPNRPLRLSAPDLFDAPDDLVEPHAVPAPTGNPGRVLVPVAMLGVLLLIGAVLIFNGGGSADDGDDGELGGGGVLPLPSATATATATVVPTMTPAFTPTPEPIATPDCHAASDWLPQITSLERRGEYRAAADNAEIAAADPDLCSDEDRLLLEAKAINVGLQALYGETFQPTDILAQQARVERFLDYRARARAASLDFPSDAQVGLDARGHGQFYLSVQAFELAFASGESTVLDRSLLQAYISSLHDLGVWRLQHSDPAIQEEGLRFFVTCHLIELTQQLGNGACQGQLVERLGPNPQEWPEPYPSPLLPRR